MLLMLGAGDITDVAARLAGRLGEMLLRQRCARERHHARPRCKACSSLATSSRCAPISANTFVLVNRSRRTRRGRSEGRPMRWSPFTTKPSLPSCCVSVCVADMAWWIIGGGSNVLVGDGGVRGIVVRLTGDFAATYVRAEGDARLGGSGRVGRNGAGNGQGGIGRRRRESARWPGSPEPSAARCA